MYYAKMTIPRVSDHYKLYVYRSRNAEDINTIAKVKELSPVLVIDESIATGSEYVLYDRPGDVIPGVTYYGPVPNIVPTVEYESTVEIAKVNNYTYMNALRLDPLPLKYNGTMLYYSVIGVDDAMNVITHLSKVNGVMVDCDYSNEGTRHLYSCDDFKNDSTDVWTYVSSVEWNQQLIIGDCNDRPTFDRFGSPVVETVPALDKDQITASLRPLTQNNFMVLEIQNPWMRNNKEFNYRKLRSFKIQNVVDEQYSEFSEPTFQSELPVSIEKMLILRKNDAADPDAIITPEEMINEDVTVYQVIRKDGVYYQRGIHKKLGLNKYNIPLGEDTAVFSEASVQEQIKMQVEALPAHVYSFTFYLIDVYGKFSEPVHVKITT